MPGLVHAFYTVTECLAPMQRVSLMILGDLLTLWAFATALMIL